MVNILYILGHKTLIDFEVPILIRNGYGVLIAKKYDSLSVGNTLHSDTSQYDNFLNIDVNDINKLNQVDWYNNSRKTNDIIDLINKHFSYIILTILVEKEGFIKQLIKSFTGKIFYRFFGRESTHRYNNMVLYDKKINYIFSYPEIYSFECSYPDNLFTSDNSHIVPVGLSNKFIMQYMSSYKPINNKICFVCSKINLNPYYTDIYNTFLNNFTSYDYLLLGKDNKINDNKSLCELDDANFYKNMSQCKLLYYHSKEARHLHYHPFEAIIIGMPVIFYNESLLSSYLPNSLGKSNTLDEIKNKINKIINNDNDFINQIITEQNKIIPLLTVEKNYNIFNSIF